MKLFVDNLTVIDCSYLDANRGMVGESWICDIVLPGALDSQSMVMDFGLVKKRIKQAIDELVDHCLLVPTLSSSIKQLDNHNGQVTLTFDLDDGGSITHISPEQALCLLEAKEINKQVVAGFLSQKLCEIVPETVEAVEIVLREEVIDGPYYHYTHGLKKHDGNCQRIAHGHRSKIEIWRNEELSTELMLKWAEKWQDITLITQGDISKKIEKDGILSTATSYVAPQGEFELIMPNERCYVMASDTTVESIAQHIAAACKQEDPTSTFRVKAYEGVQKGAIAEA